MYPSNAGSVAGAGIVFFLVYLVLIVLVIAAIWKIFQKAHQPGWAALVPFYNIYVLCKIAGRPDWFIILFFLPLANFVAAILLAFDVAKVFGKGGAFGFFGLLLFAPIGYMILGFGSAVYVGPLQAGQSPIMPTMPPPTAPMPPTSPTPSV